MKCDDIKTKPGKWLLGCVCIWLASSLLAVAEETKAMSDYQVKAEFLCRFTMFTDWPTNSFASPNSPIVIGIVGKDPFGKSLDILVKDVVVRGHPLVVKRLNIDEDLMGCHELFISSSEKERLATLLQKLKGSPVLTVGDADSFAEQGGMINFVLVHEKVTVEEKVIIQDRVKFEINQAVAEQASLKFSSKLLASARIVKSSP